MRLVRNRLHETWRNVPACVRARHSISAITALVGDEYRQIGLSDHKLPLDLAAFGRVESAPQFREQFFDVLFDVHRRYRLEG
jgi:hypothetical protein